MSGAGGRRLPRFAKAGVAVEPLAEGGMILRSPLEPAAVARRIGDKLASWAAWMPHRVFLAEREGADWRRITYDEAHNAARTIGQALLDRRLGPERPVMILSDNGIDHALLALGAMYVGVPVAPVSTAYSLVSRDYAKLRSVTEQLTPGLVFAADGARYAPALEAIKGQIRSLGAAVAVSRDPPAGMDATSLGVLRAARPRQALEDAFHRVGPDTVAKILFTSGSTGEPKGVVNTQRMLCSNQAGFVLAWPFLADRPPVALDWLPWSHTFGGNSNFNLILFNGGTLWIDDGKPAPGLIERTVENLRALSPTLYCNVPRGFALLLDYLEREPELARRFFAELDLLLYAGAALPQTLWERLESVAMAVTGEKPAFVSAWGTTETAPCATIVHYPMERAGNIGLPHPGTEIKLVPEGDRLEIRVRGPNVTPGYWRRPDLTEAAFDADGFYRPGDAVRLEDPSDPSRGLVFDGRIGENFKLSSGTWVLVGALRIAAIAAAAPVAEDAVIAGHDRDTIGLLLFPSLAGCRALCPHLGAAAPLAALIAEPAVRQAVIDGLRRHNETAGGSSRRIDHALLMAEPPSIDQGEITDKGYINQRAVLSRRAALVARLYAEPPDANVIVL
ncbi:MAG TPA: feruloyl-CoA synthase [Stellaceae bacterium]|nr:feruloyl-CoA synthase [Stellaceae bacterium]